MAKLSRLASIMESRFRGRPDCVLVERGSGLVVERWNERLSKSDIEEHLHQNMCYGVLPLLDSGYVRFAAIDLDDKLERPNPSLCRDTRRIFRKVNELGLSTLVEVSQSGRGRHLWFFFDKPVAAWLVRIVLKALLDMLGIRRAEIFPKQAKLAPGRVGNGIRLPLSRKSKFIDLSNGEAKLDPVSDAFRRDVVAFRSEFVQGTNVENTRCGLPCCGTSRRQPRWDS